MYLAMRPLIATTAILCLAIVILPFDTGTGSISLAALDVAIPTEHFDTLSNTAGSTTNTALPTGWYITESGGGARDNEQYAVDTGFSTTGDIYSYGAAGSTERALGELRSGTEIPLFGAKLTNNTGATITSLDVSYTGEQWRFGGVHSTVADRLDFQYSSNATDLSTGTYLDANALDFNPPVTAGSAVALDGNAAANRTAISSTITGLSIPNGASVFIRFTDVDATGADDGLAIDDLSVTPHGVATPGLSINDVSQSEGNAGTTNFNFTVSLDSPAQVGGVGFTVNTADGTANAPGDYTTILNGTGSIPQGSSSTQVTVQVNGDGTPEANETFFVNITNVTGATVTDGQGQGTINNDDATIVAIHDIQGSGVTSPLAGQSVTTNGVITGIKSGSGGGFFLQTPDANADADPNTSEGIFVFTGASVPAGAVIGNLVQVAGTVTEFIPSTDPTSPPLTEITTPTVSVLSTGNPLPAASTITAADTQVNNVNNLEKYEGMRVTVASLTVVDPTSGAINEAAATVATDGVFYGVANGLNRPFREPGIPITSTVPPPNPPNVPRFDMNPERLRIDSDGQVGAAAIDVKAGAVVTNLVGPLFYEAATYTLLPDAATVPVVNGNTGGAAALPVPTAAQLTIASMEMQRFYDTTDDLAIADPILTTTAFNNRLNKVSLAVRNVLQTPDVIGVQEVENLATLQAVAAKINADAVSAAQPNPNYQAYLFEGNDLGGLDVGFLVKTSRISVNSVTQIGATATYTNPDTSAQDLIFDRPPLVLQATVPRPGGGSMGFTVIVNHLRSISGIDDPVDGNRIRTKRRAGAEFLANYIQARQTGDPTEKLVTLGNMNAYQFNDGYVDVIGTIAGAPAPPDQVVQPSPDLVNPDQTVTTNLLTAGERYTYVSGGNAIAFDHLILNNPMLAIHVQTVVARVNADYPTIFYQDPNRPERFADHDVPVGYFSISAPSAARVSVGGRVTDSSGAGVRNARVSISRPDGGVSIALTNAFGYYQFDGVEVGHDYVMQAQSKRLAYASRIVSVGDSLSDVDFAPQ
jgi:predicted extracellular nuclease